MALQQTGPAGTLATSSSSQQQPQALTAAASAAPPAAAGVAAPPATAPMAAAVAVPPGSGPAAVLAAFTSVLTGGSEEDRSGDPATAIANFSERADQQVGLQAVAPGLELLELTGVPRHEAVRTVADGLRDALRGTRSRTSKWSARHRFRFYSCCPHVHDVCVTWLTFLTTPLSKCVSP